jgi:multimeric flavodoxin WrbA
MKSPRQNWVHAQRAIKKKRLFLGILPMKTQCSGDMFRLGMVLGAGQVSRLRTKKRRAIMKLTAFTAGRPRGNTEILVKEALMGASSKGVEVELIRLTDCDLHNCRDCAPGFCPATVDVTKCPYGKDDTSWLIEKFLDSDGCIIGAPCFSLTPSSLLLTFRDRVFGPKMDVAAESLGMPSPPWAKGRFKNRPGGLIGVGGALTEHWTSLNLPTIYTATFSAQTEVVDHLNVFGVADENAAALYDKWLEKARRLGENVADAMLTGDHRWRGENEGICPACHLNMIMVVPGTDDVICPICGIRGKISVKDGVTCVDWPDTEECRKDNRMQVFGKAAHLREIMYCRETYYAPYAAEAAEKAKKYHEFTSCVLTPPSRQK